MVFKLIAIGFSILTSYFIYYLSDLLDLTKDLVLHDDEKCERVSLNKPTEDLVLFEDFLIGVTGDSVSMYYKHLSAANIAPGSIVSINIFTKQAQNVTIHDFPSEFQMNAHGISLYNTNTLYVLSHSYDKGGEIIFVFKLTKTNETIEAKFTKYIKISNEHGVYNGISIIDTNHFYVTQ